jgi:CheY-like chemotaxis protein
LERSPLILLVEDDAAIRDAVAECLETEGYRVQAAGDGAEALTWLARGEQPALIVLDLVMPVMNGAELLAQVRADPALERVPTLLMTAAIVSGATPLPEADATLVKPFDLDQLLGAIGRLVPRA